MNECRMQRTFSSACALGCRATMSTALIWLLAVVTRKHPFYSLYPPSSLVTHWVQDWRSSLISYDCAILDDSAHRRTKKSMRTAKRSSISRGRGLWSRVGWPFRDGIFHRRSTCSRPSALSPFDVLQKRTVASSSESGKTLQQRWYGTSLFRGVWVYYVKDVHPVVAKIRSTRSQHTQTRVGPRHPSWFSACEIRIKNRRVA